MPKIALDDEDLRHLQVALLAYGGDRRHMARVMDDGRYLNDLPWIEAFKLRLAALKEEAHA